MRELIESKPTSNGTSRDAISPDVGNSTAARKPGRPKSDKSMTNAERQKKHRAASKTIKTGERIAATITRLAQQFDLSEQQVTRELIRFALCNKNWSSQGFPTTTKEPS